MRLARVAGRTRIVQLESRAPLQALRCHYLDPAFPDMAFVMIASPSGGVLQGDRLRIEVELGPGARLHLDTQSATRLYRMPDRPASLETILTLAPEAWLEYIPDPYLPYAGSAFDGRTRAVVDSTASLVLGEVVGAGRVARGEIHHMTRFDTLLEVERPDGSIVFSDALAFAPGEQLSDPGMLGAGFGPGAAVGSLHVVHAGFRPEALRVALSDESSEGTYWGASSLPAGAGAWLRAIAPDTSGARGAVSAGHGAARSEILGSLPPASRRP